MIKHVIFDLDGTLIDSAEDIIDSLEQAFSMRQVPLKQRLSRSFIGPPIREIINKVSPELSSKEVAQLISTFRDIYDNSVYPKTHPYTGVRELLNDLKLQQISMFIVTNKPRVPTERLLDKLNLRSYFKDIICINDHQFATKVEMVTWLLNQYSLETQVTIMIGDTLQDVLAGISNCLVTAAYLGGYGNSGELAASQAQFKFGHIISVKYLINHI